MVTFLLNKLNTDMQKIWYKSIINVVETDTTIPANSSVLCTVEIDAPEGITFISNSFRDFIPVDRDIVISQSYFSKSTLNVRIFNPTSNDILLLSLRYMIVGII